jgi:hypothetical protein
MQAFSALLRMTVLTMSGCSAGFCGALEVTCRISAVWQTWPRAGGPGENSGQASSTVTST